MSYTQNPSYWEAVQLGSGEGAQDAFIATVDPDSNFTWNKNEDGTIDYHNPAGGIWHVDVMHYAVSQSWVGSFPGWNGLASDTPLSPTDFAIYYSAV